MVLSDWIEQSTPTASTLRSTDELRKHGLLNQIWTGVPAVRERNPKPLEDEKMVAEMGIAPMRVSLWGWCSATELLRIGS